MNSSQRSTNEQALALALVVFLNWLLSHLANSWTMPTEVQSSVQTAFSILLAYYLDQKNRRELEKQLAMARTLGWTPPPVPPANDPTPPTAEPAPKAA